MRGLRRRKEDDEIEKDIRRHKEDGVRGGENERENDGREGVRDRGVQKGICFV